LRAEGVPIVIARIVLDSSDRCGFLDGLDGLDEQLSRRVADRLVGVVS
jgi:hypothetical protein